MMLAAHQRLSIGLAHRLGKIPWVQLVFEQAPLNILGGLTDYGLIIIWR
jgi:hypothetical protein